jgi:DNA topoisomerase-1
MQRIHWITRQKQGKGFAYYDNGYLVTDKSEINYYRSLAVPPDWSEVRIAASRDARILATGVDGSGRRRSIYQSKSRAKQLQNTA